MNQRKNKSNAGILFLLAGLFMAPFVFGSVSYFFRDSLHFNSNARGQVLSPCLATQVLNSPVDNFIDNFLGKWQVLYFAAEQCDTACQKHFQLLQNIRLALGKDQFRVVLHQIPFIQEKMLPNKNSQPLPLATGSVLIIDPKGWLVTHYSASTFHAKDILEDLRRLMRYSYVG